MQDDIEQTATETKEKVEPLLSDEPSQQVQEIQNLSKELERERDARKEERLVWILISLILLNVVFFTSMQSVLGPLVIGGFELVVIVIIAQKMGLEEAVQLIDKLLGTVAKATTKTD